MEKYFVNYGEKRINMACSKDFTQGMTQKYPNVFTGIGKLEGMVKIDL